MPNTNVFTMNRSRSNGPNRDVRGLFGHGNTKGDIGIEVEVEGNKFPKQDYYDALIPKQWRYTHDGSLRGQDNAEYVCRKPLKFDDVEKALSDLWGMFDEFGSVLADSNRTSVHVHLNVQEFHLNRLCSFMAIYIVLEEILTEWCGDHRVGNLFCLRAKDAPAIVSHMKEFFLNDGHSSIRDGMHYAGMNAQALAKFGSLEFRALRGVNDPSIILNWVNILRRIYDVSGDYPDPREVCDQYSSAGPMEFFTSVLGPLTNTVMEGVNWSPEQISDSLLDGIQLAQDICYCRDWSEYRPAIAKTDPFGRTEYVDENGQAIIETAMPSNSPNNPLGMTASLMATLPPEPEDYEIDDGIWDEDMEEFE